MGIFFDNVGNKYFEEKDADLTLTSKSYTFENQINQIASNNSNYYLFSDNEATVFRLGPLNTIVDDISNANLKVLAKYPSGVNSCIKTELFLANMICIFDASLYLMNINTGAFTLIASNDAVVDILVINQFLYVATEKNIYTFSNLPTSFGGFPTYTLPASANNAIISKITLDYWVNSGVSNFFVLASEKTEDALTCYFFRGQALLGQATTDNETYFGDFFHDKFFDIKICFYTKINDEWIALVANLTKTFSFDFSNLHINNFGVGYTNEGPSPSNGTMIWSEINSKHMFVASTCNDDDTITEYIASKTNHCAKSDYKNLADIKSSLSFKASWKIFNNKSLCVTTHYASVNFLNNENYFDYLISVSNVNNFLTRTRWLATNENRIYYNSNDYDSFSNTTEAINVINYSQYILENSFNVVVIKIGDGLVANKIITLDIDDNDDEQTYFVSYTPSPSFGVLNDSESNEDMFNAICFINYDKWIGHGGNAYDDNEFHYDNIGSIPFDTSSVYFVNMNNGEVIKGGNAGGFAYSIKAGWIDYEEEGDDGNTFIQAEFEIQKVYKSGGGGSGNLPGLSVNGNNGSIYTYGDGQTEIIEAEKYVYINTGQPTPNLISYIDKFTRMKIHPTITSELDFYVFTEDKPNITRILDNHYIIIKNTYILLLKIESMTTYYRKVFDPSEWDNIETYLDIFNDIEDLSDNTFHSIDSVEVFTDMNNDNYGYSSGNGGSAVSIFDSLYPNVTHGADGLVQFEFNEDYLYKGYFEEKLCSIVGNTITEIREYVYIDEVEYIEPIDISEWETGSWIVCEANNSSYVLTEPELPEENRIFVFRKHLSSDDININLNNAPHRYPGGYWS